MAKIIENIQEAKVGDKTIKVGDTIETKFGEKIKVISISEVDGVNRFLAKSGDSNTWFSENKIK